MVAVAVGVNEVTDSVIDWMVEDEEQEDAVLAGAGAVATVLVEEEEEEQGEKISSTSMGMTTLRWVVPSIHRHAL
jgi:hypothetical protein